MSAIGSSVHIVAYLALFIALGGVAAGLISVPNRYMHSAVEMISLDDIDRAADLLAEFVASLNGDEDFRP